VSAADVRTVFTDCEVTEFAVVALVFDAEVRLFELHVADFAV
jgi:hypothetical protein